MSGSPPVLLQSLVAGFFGMLADLRRLEGERGDREFLNRGGAVTIVVESKRCI